MMYPKGSLTIRTKSSLKYVDLFVNHEYKLSKYIHHRKIPPQTKGAYNMSKHKQYRRRVNIRFREETYEKLVAIAENNKQTISETIRDIVLKEVK